MGKRCYVVCSSNRYHFHKLQNFLSEKYKTTNYRHAIHRTDGECEIFYFPKGPIVFWNLDKGLEKGYLLEIEPFILRDTYETFIEDDEFTFDHDLSRIESSDTFTLKDDHLQLPHVSISTLLALSFALAQSTKLAVFEATLNHRFEESRHIPETLAREGKIKLSKRELRSRMGAIFLEKSSINLHYDLLDTPEFFWNHSELEPYYQKLAKYLEITSRVEVLNKKLDTLQDLFNMLNNELDGQHESRLEMMIIFLILIEIVLSLLKDYIKVF